MIKSIKSNLNQFIIGNDDKIELSMAAIIAGGSILLEDQPGTGKTTFAKLIANSLGLDFKRIQFTSDMLPSDINGFVKYINNEPNFQKGPIFSNIILADELNRGNPKCQSAFMEAMEEKSVTIDGSTHNLPKPFFVIATQNPTEQVGTYPLPESQLDRFMISFSMNKLDHDQEKEILKQKSNNQNINSLNIDIQKTNKFAMLFYMLIWYDYRIVKKHKQNEAKSNLNHVDYSQNYEKRIEKQAFL